MRMELADVTVNGCRALAAKGRVISSPLHQIPFPSNHFDLVWSSEVLEYVPTDLVNASIREMVRVAKRHIFCTIAMKPSGFDPPPPALSKFAFDSWYKMTFQRPLYACVAKHGLQREGNTIFERNVLSNLLKEHWFLEPLAKLRSSERPGNLM